MYDSLWEENPKVQQIQAKAAEEGRRVGLIEGRRVGLTEGHTEGLTEGRKEGLTEGRKEGLTEGRKEGLTEGRKEGLTEGRKEGLIEGRVVSSRESVMKIVRKRFPQLADPASQRVAQIQSYEALDMLMDILLDTPDEASARIILRLNVA